MKYIKDLNKINGLLNFNYIPKMLFARIYYCSHLYFPRSERHWLNSLRRKSMEGILVGGSVLPTEDLRYITEYGR